MVTVTTQLTMREQRNISDAHVRVGSRMAASTSASILFLQGHSSEGKNMQKALDHFLRSCDLGHTWGRANASRILKLGDGVDPDPVRANKLKQRAKKLARL